MGFEDYIENRNTCKEKIETLEIVSQNNRNCDNVESFNIDLLDCIAQRICDITIDIKKLSTLELAHCDLTALPIECKQLNLRRLDLSHNKLKEVPLCLYSGLKYLESLDLGHNSIERFDMEPECLPYVKVIKLNNNKFENIPKWFLMFKCTNLEEFYYSHNKAKHYKYLKNSINLNNMRLRRLELKNNYLIDNDYNFLKCFKFLEHLDISNEGANFYNKFNDLDDLFVKPRWKKLSVLRLNGLSLSILPEGIAWMYTLKELYVRNNCLSWLPDSIEYLVNLEVLDISNNNIVAITSSVLSLEKLTTLLASKNCIDALPDIAQMPNLKILDLYDNNLGEVTCGTTNFNFVDLEYNFCNTKDLEQPTYQEKKNSLRKKYEVEERYEGPKEHLQPPESPPYDPEKDDYFENYSGSFSTHPATIDEDEDWDSPGKVRDKNPEIDSVDDEWDGEERKRARGFRTKNKVYVSDDDWMFADYEGQ